MIIINEYKSIKINEGFGGYWVLAGDLNRDGLVEFVCVNTQNVLTSGVKSHFVTSIAVHDIDGNLLWAFGEQSVQKEKLGYDVPCQIYDVDGDGNDEVVFCTNHNFIILDGKTGETKGKYELPLTTATDNIVFLGANDHTDTLNILIKERYREMWAYSSKWELQWHFQHPKKLHIGHHPVVLHTNSGKYFLTGFMLLNSQGEKIWELKSRKYDLSKGHFDSCKIIEIGHDYRDWLFVISTCKAKVLMLVNGRGEIIWEKYGQHFERVSIGNYNETNIIIVDIKDDLSKLSPELWFIDMQGNTINKIYADLGTSYHFHSLVKFESIDAIAIASSQDIYNLCGQRVASLHLLGDTKGYNIFQANLNGVNHFYVLITENLQIAMFEGVGDCSNSNLGTPNNYSLF